MALRQAGWTRAPEHQNSVPQQARPTHGGARKQQAEQCGIEGFWRVWVGKREREDPLGAAGLSLFAR